MRFMNRCHYCGEQATIHLTTLLTQKKMEQHLCERCAREQGVIKGESTAAAPLDLSALVQLILKQQPSLDLASLKCPECGLKYAQIQVDGRLGCPHDYDLFRQTLEPLLERIHRASRHSGKGPLARGRRTKLNDLRVQLNAAIADERYEEAAQLRDLIREKGGVDEPR
jgi:protein arginine kinase activator